MKKKKKKNIIISADPWPIKKVKINETKQAEKEETANHSKIDVNRNSKSDEKQPKKTP